MPSLLATVADAMYISCMPGILRLLPPGDGRRCCGCGGRRGADGLVGRDYQHGEGETPLSIPHIALHAFPLSVWRRFCPQVGRFTNLFFGIDYLWALVAHRSGNSVSTAPVAGSSRQQQCLHNFFSGTTVIDLYRPVGAPPLLGAPPR